MTQTHEPFSHEPPSHEPQTVTIDHVHALLQLDSDAAVLGLVEGRVEALDPQQLESDEYRGVLEVVSRGELTQLLGPHPTAQAMADHAEALTAAVQHLGG